MFFLKAKMTSKCRHLEMSYKNLQSLDKTFLKSQFVEIRLLTFSCSWDSVSSLLFFFFQCSSFLISLTMKFLSCVQEISRNDLDFHCHKKTKGSGILNYTTVAKFKSMKRKFYVLACPVSLLDPVPRKQWFLAAKNSNLF